MYRLRVPWLTLRPSVRRVAQQLIITTPWPMRALSLGGFARTVHLDGEAKYVYIHERSLWLVVRTRVIRFREVSRLRYGFGALPTGMDRFGRVHDTIERFSICLELANSDEWVPIASFIGSGATGDLGTLVMGDSLVDVEGVQEESSRELVEEICKLTGWSVGPAEVRVTDAQGRTYRCLGCGRPVAPRPTCLYCGGDTRSEP